MPQRFNSFKKAYCFDNYATITIESPGERSSSSDENSVWNPDNDFENYILQEKLKKASKKLLRKRGSPNRISRALRFFSSATNHLFSKGSKIRKCQRTRSTSSSILEKKSGADEDDTSRYSRDESETQNSFASLICFWSTRHYPVLFIAVFFAAASGLCDVATTKLLGLLFDAISKFSMQLASRDEIRHEVLKHIAGIVAVGASAFFINSVFLSLWIFLGNAASRRARQRLFSHLVNQDLLFFEMLDSDIRGLLTSLAKDFENLHLGLSQPMGYIIHSTVVFLASIGLAFYQSWYLTLIMLTTTPLVVLTVGITSALCVKHLSREKQLSENASNQFQWCIDAIEVVKSFNSREMHLTSIQDLITRSGRAYLHFVNVLSLQKGIARALILSLFVQGFWVGNVFIKQNKLTAGSVFTVFWACFTAANSLQGIIPQLPFIERARKATSHLHNIDSRCSSVTEDNSSIAPKEFKGKITFNKVSFSYPTRPNQMVLNGLSLSFEAGKTTYVVGQSGCGKSTLGLLMTRIYSVDFGFISIDDHPIEVLSKSFIRKHVLYIEQNSVLFDGTILENITLNFNNTEFDKSRVQEVMRVCMINEFVKILPQAEDTRLESKINLSGGQRQRLALARALFMNCPVMIMDESVSALDTVLRELVMKAVLSYRRNLTNIIITHDIDSIPDDGFVYAMQSDQILNSGFAKDVLRNGLADGSNTCERGFNGNNVNLSSVLVSKDQRLLSVKPSLCPIGEGPMKDPPFKGMMTINLPGQSHDSVIYSEKSGLQSTHFFKSRSSLLFAGFNSNSRDIRKSILNQIAPVNEEEYMVVSSVNKLRPRDHFRRAQRRKPLQYHTDQRTHDAGTRQKGASNTEMNSSITGTTSQTQSNDPEKSLVNVAEIQRKSYNSLLSLVSMSFRENRVRSLYIFGLIFTVAAGAMTPIFSFVMSKLLASLFEPDSSSKTRLAAIATLAIAIGDGLFTYLHSILLEIASESWICMLKNEAFCAILSQPVSFFNSALRGAGSLSTVIINSSEELRDLIAKFIGNILLALVMTLVGFIWAFAVGWKLSLMIFAVLPVMIAAGKVFALTLGYWVKKLKSLQETTSNEFYEAIAKVKTVQMLSLEQERINRISVSLALERSCCMSQALYSGLSFALIESVTIFSQALLLWFGTRLVLTGEYTVQQMLQAFSLVIFSASQGNMSIEAMPQIKSAQTAAERIIELRNLHTASHESYGHLSTAIKGSVSAKQLFFRYESAKHVSLADVSFSIPQGAKIALVGSSGSGKSTMLALLLRLYEHGGSLRIDGNPIESFDIAWLRQNVAFVPQNSAIFPGTVLENIAYGSPKIHESEAIYASKQAFAHEFIMSLPQGYHTDLAANVSSLSGGQAQRICLARALYRQPRILLLDECTSALDLNSARKVQNAIAAVSNCTVIMATHSRELMKVADEVLVMKNGRLVQQGTIDELLKSKGEFMNLWNEGAWIS